MSVQAFPIPLVITGNQPSAIAFAPPLQGLGTAQAVRLSNVSPYVAELTFGFGASTFGLAPGEINIWEWFSGKGSIEVNFEPGPSNITNAYFMIEVSDVGLSDFPGTYPSTVSLATVTIEGSTTLDTLVTNTASEPVPVDLTTALPAGANTIGTVDLASGTTVGLANGTAVSSNVGTYYHINTLESVEVKGSPGTLHKVVVNNPGSAFVITLYDNTAASGSEIAVISPTAVGTIEYEANFATGLYVVTSGTTAGDITLVYS